MYRHSVIEIGVLELRYGELVVLLVLNCIASVYKVGVLMDINAKGGLTQFRELLTVIRCAPKHIKC